MFNISLSCSAETKEDAVALFEQHVSQIKNGKWQDGSLGFGGCGEVVCRHIGPGCDDPFARLDRVASAVDGIAKKLKDVWDVWYK